MAALYARYGKAQADDRSSGALRDAMQLSEVYLASFASLRLERAVAGSSIWCPDMERELFMYLRDDPERVFDLTPRRFEELVAAIFRNNGFAVELGPQTRDGGVDIIAVEHSALTGIGVHLIECKRYHRSKTVGIGVVQRLIGAVTQRRATKGIVVATSSFTRDAVRVAEETRHLIALNDYTSIVGWLDSLGRPGRALV